MNLLNGVLGHRLLLSSDSNWMESIPWDVRNNASSFRPVPSAYVAGRDGRCQMTGLASSCRSSHGPRTTNVSLKSPTTNHVQVPPTACGAMGTTAARPVPDTQHPIPPRPHPSPSRCRTAMPSQTRKVRAPLRVLGCFGSGNAVALLGGFDRLGREVGGTAGAASPAVETALTVLRAPCRG